MEKSECQTDPRMLLDVGLYLLQHAVALGAKFCFPLADRVELTLQATCVRRTTAPYSVANAGQVLVNFCQSAPGPSPATSLVTDGHLRLWLFLILQVIDP
jgi:hypothetical protein